MKRALVLEGGGMRGVYTAGVLDGFMDNGIHIPLVYGVSAGACHACSYLSGQRGRALRTVVDYLDDPRYASVRSLLRTGDFFGARMIYDDIPNRLLPYDYQAFLDAGPEFYAVATNCLTGEAEYLPVRDMRRDTTAVRASSSLPLLSRMVEIGGTPYLDGGMADSIPLAKAMADGARQSIVVLTQHRGYRKGPSGFGRAMGLRYRRYPGLVAAMARRHQQYNRALELVYEQERLGAAFVIQPKAPVTIGRLEKDKEKLMALYREGCRDGRAAVPLLEAFLGKEKAGI